VAGMILMWAANNNRCKKMAFGDIPAGNHEPRDSAKRTKNNYKLEA